MAGKSQGNHSQTARARTVVIIIYAIAMSVATEDLFGGVNYALTAMQPLATSGGSSYYSWYNPIAFVDGQVVGFGYGPAGANTGLYHALLSNSMTGTTVDLNPAGFRYSYALDASGTDQVGYGAAPGTLPHALFWTGTAASVVDLNPSGFFSSVGYGIYGSQQVGGANNGTTNVAMLWSGTASSAVPLPKPVGFLNTSADGMNGTQQVGGGSGPATGNNNHALLWSGATGPVVDLNPAGFTDSYAVAISGNEQVGYGDGTPSMSSGHALVWSGTANSAVDLNPAGFTASYAIGANGIDQVGYGIGAPAGHGSGYYAMLWSGTAGSAVDLGVLLPPIYSSYSEASSIDSAGNVYGWTYGLGSFYAVEWSPVPEPTSAGLLAISGAGLLIQRRQPKISRL
jgi:hypothetical protein